MNCTYVAQYSVWCQQRLMGELFLVLSPVVHSMFNWPSCPHDPPSPSFKLSDLAPSALTAVRGEINQMLFTATCWWMKWTDTLLIVYCRCALNQGVERSCVYVVILDLHSKYNWIQTKLYYWGGIDQMWVIIIALHLVYSSLLSLLEERNSNCFFRWQISLAANPSVRNV